MPLSEEELRLLEQMERALVEEDPKFASTLRGTTLRSIARRKAILAGIAFVVGVAVMMAGVIWWLPAGIVGFLIMLASATFGLSVLRGQRGGSAPAAAAEPVPEPEHGGHHGFTLIHGGRKERRRRNADHGGGFMERMEERWRRRRETGGF